MEVALLERIHTTVARVTLMHDEWLASKRCYVDRITGALRPHTVHGKGNSTDLVAVELALLSAQHTRLREATVGRRTQHAQLLSAGETQSGTVALTV